MKHLAINEEAPMFEGQDKDGKTVRLADFKGKKIALYFYPKDMTPGCTNQACNLRDNFSLLKKEGIEIIGVSPDDVARHEKFAGKYELPFTLIADPEKEIINAYGVWGPKTFMGKKYDGVHRTTFLINEEGKIHAIIEKPKVKAHAEEIIAAFQS